MLDTHARKYVQPVIEKTAKSFLKKGLSADQVTWIGFLIGASVGVLTYFQLPVVAVLILWFSGFLDAVDGTMARLTHPSSWGTVLDITFDRIVEISVLLGLAFAFPESQWALLLLSVSIIISMTVFLTVGATSKKRNEKSFYYQAGLAERTEGFILFSLMILFSEYLTQLTLLFFAIILFTAVQRLLEAKRIFTEQEADQNEEI